MKGTASRIVMTILLTGAFLSASPPQTTPDTRTVALLGQAAPGSNGAQFVGFGFPSVNSSGAVAFVGELTPINTPYGKIPGKTIPRVLFLAPPDGPMRRIVGFKDAIPNEASFFSDVGNPVLNDAGEIAFRANVGSGATDQRIFLQTDNELLPIARTGNPAPGTGENFKTLGILGLALNNTRTVAFEGTYGTSGQGIFTYSNGTVRPVVLRGQPVPSGVVGSFVSFEGVGLNETGQIVFTATIQTVTNGNVVGVFVASGTNIKAAAVEGQSAPYAVGGNFNSLRVPSINDSGDVAFVDSISAGKGNPASSPRGVFVITRGGATAVASDRRERPSDPVTSGNFYSVKALRTNDGNSAVMFIAWNDTNGRKAVFLYTQAKLQQLVQQGDTTPAGGRYSLITTDISIAKTGYFAFAANVEGSTSTKAGIFVGKASL